MRSIVKDVMGWVLVCLSTLHAQDPQILHLPLPRGMDRADLVYLHVVENPVAVLVLCPGHNGNAKELVEQKVWIEYAKKNRLGLVGLSFSSPEDSLAHGQGYYEASEGSGDCLIKGIENIFHRSSLPVLLYGFSGGAHFAANFAEWKPERVKGWCSYSAAWWTKPVVNEVKAYPPGIICCGEVDRYRRDASLLFFKQGRALERPWMWIELRGQDHSRSTLLDAFVRSYFAALLEGKPVDGIYVDLESMEVARVPVPYGQQVLYGWLPAAQLFTELNKLSQP